MLRSLRFVAGLLILIGSWSDSAIAEFGLGPIVGPRRALVVMLETAEIPFPCTNAQVTKMLTGNNPSSLNSFYTKASYGKISFDVEIAGLYTITSTCLDFEALKAEADSKLAENGFVTANYDHIIYLTKGLAGCRSNGSYDTPAPALVTLNYVENKNFCAGPLLHEVGHGLGFNHSRSPGDAYGDLSDVMGKSDVSLYMNSAHGIESGWIPEAKMQTVSASGNYKLSAIESDPASARHPQVLRISSSQPNTDYYISFRAARGFKRNTDSQRRQARRLINRTYIHLISYRDSAGFPFPRLVPELRGLLADHQTFSDSTDNIVVKQRFHSRSTATIKIQIPLAGSF